MKKYIIFISIVFIANKLQSQINDSLFVLVSQTKVKDFVWDPYTPYRLISVAFDIQINNDSLYITNNTINTLKYENEDSEVMSSSHKYIANIKDIGKIDFINNLITPKYGEPFYDCKIEIESIKDQETFDSIYDNGTKRKTWHIPIRVWKLSDSTKFKQISELLNNYVQPNLNYQPADCSTTKNHEWSGKEINAIDNIRTESQIHLNGNLCTEQEIKKLTKELLFNQNIKGILGYLIIDEENQLESVWTEQNNLYILFNSENEIPLGMKTIKENIGTMTNEQLNELTKVLNSQIWKTGKCEGKSQRTYFDFAIKNNKYKVPGDNK